MRCTGAAAGLVSSPPMSTTPTAANVRSSSTSSCAFRSPATIAAGGASAAIVLGEPPRLAQPGQRAVGGQVGVVHAEGVAGVAADGGADGHPAAEAAAALFDRERGVPHVVERPGCDDRQALGAPPHEHGVRVVLEDPLGVPPEAPGDAPRLAVADLLEGDDIGRRAGDHAGDEGEVGLGRAVQVPRHHPPRGHAQRGGERHRRSLASGRYVAPPWIVWRARWR